MLRSQDSFEIAILAFSIEGMFAAGKTVPIVGKIPLAIDELATGADCPRSFKGK